MVTFTFDGKHVRASSAGNARCERSVSRSKMRSSRTRCSNGSTRGAKKPTIPTRSWASSESASRMSPLMTFADDIVIL